MKYNNQLSIFIRTGRRPDRGVRLRARHLRHQSAIAQSADLAQLAHDRTEAIRFRAGRPQPASIISSICLIIRSGSRGQQQSAGRHLGVQT